MSVVRGGRNGGGWRSRATGAAAFALFTFGSTSSFAGQECATGSTLEGVDLNADGDTLDWSSAKGDGVSFAIVKATQGTTYTNGDFASSWSSMKSAGVVRGAYHFFDPTVGGVDQANFFLGVLGTLEPGDLPPTLDIECPTSNDEPDSDDCLGNGTSGDATGAQITQAMLDWLQTVEAATGRKPMLYSYGSYFSDLGVDTTGLDAYPLWLADYSGTNCFNVPSPWSAATIWQYGDSGDVSGLGNGVDQDYFLGTLTQLTAFTHPTVSTDAGADTGADAATPPFAAPSQANGNDALSLVSWADGHVELYATEASGLAARLDTLTTGTAPHDTWSAPTPFAGAASCGVASVYGAGAGGSVVFAGLANGTTESLAYDASTESWSAFAPFGGVGLNHLSTLAYAGGVVEVFAQGDDGNLWHDVSPSSGGGGPGSWSGWSALSPGNAGLEVATGAGPILSNDGHGEVFVTDASGRVWHAETGPSSPGTWGAWSVLGGATIASRPVPARWADGHVEVFARGTDGVLYASTSAATAGASFADFTALNPTETIAGDPSVLVYADYGPELFAKNAAGDVVHMWNTSGVWSTWANDFGEVLASDPLAWLRPDGLAEVFGVDASGHVVKSLHDGPTWSAWTTLGAGFDACVGGTALVDAGVPVSLGDAGKNDGGTVVGQDAGATVDGSVVSRGTDAGAPLGASASKSGGCSFAGAPGRAAPSRSVGWLTLAALGLVARRRKQGAGKAG